jgi:predicted nucleic acid-binding protein
MPGKPFVDTNVLVYSIVTQGADAAKGEQARALLQAQDVCLSTQVLGEFYFAVTRPRSRSPLTREEAVAWVQLWKRYEVQSITTAHVDLALEVAARFGVSYWDSLIVAAARLAGCALIFSEDLNDGQDYGGVRVENPFR